METPGRMTIPKSCDVRSEGIQMLVGRMGIAKAALFIRDNLSQQEDYLVTKERLFADRTAAEIREDMKKSGY